MVYPSDLADDQWDLLEPVFNAPGKRGRKHADDLRTVVDAMLYIVHTGCQWRYLPASFGPWTRVWSQFRHWSRTASLVLDRDLNAAVNLARYTPGQHTTTTPPPRAAA
jgi:putative transposase